MEFALDDELGDRRVVYVDDYRIILRCPCGAESILQKASLNPKTISKKCQKCSAKRATDGFRRTPMVSRAPFKS